MTQSISGYPSFNAEGTPEDVMDYLRDLDADEIAALFTAAEIKGQRYAAGRCPVANFVRTVTGIDRIIVTSMDYCYADTLGPIAHLTPSSVGQFIVRFDDAQYPGLVADGLPIDWSAA